MFINSTSGTYKHKIERSLRLRASASAYLSRTPASAGNQSVWTWHGWFRRGSLTSFQWIFGAGTLSAGGNCTGLSIGGSGGDSFNLWWNTSATSTDSAGQYRDPSAWYPLTLVANVSTLTLYLGMDQIAQRSISGAAQVNNTTVHRMGSRPDMVGTLVDGYYANVHFVDGQALGPSNFLNVNADNVPVPKAYTGTFGAQGWYVPFNDGSNLTNLCLDRSGNGNNWTATNVSLTAGATYDWMVDTPTNNYCVWNPLSAIGVPMVHSAGNLETGTTGYTALSSFVLPTGKWYAEFGFSSATNPRVGVVDATETDTNMQGSKAISYGTSDGAGKGELWINGVQNNSLTTAGTTSDIYGIAYDSSTRKVWFSKNGVWQNFTGSGADPATATNPVGTLAGSSDVYIGARTATASVKANFGQRPFAYTPPTGFKALCTANLPAVAIPNGKLHFDIDTYTGNGAHRSRSGFKFSPGLVHIKSRSHTDSNNLYDNVRGPSRLIWSDLGNVGIVDNATLTSFNSNGYSLGPDTSHRGVNVNSETHVAFLWKAGYSVVQNYDGTIPSKISVNRPGGFSIVSFIGTGGNATVGHGLGVSPQLIIIKNTTEAYSWPVYHNSLLATQTLYYNTTAAAVTVAAMWNSTRPDSKRIYVGASSSANSNGATSIAYCFTEVQGFSKFSSYTGNGSTDGPFVYCGFRPRWIMVKRSDAGSENWFVIDSARDTYNVAQNYLLPSSSGAEAVLASWDMLSNGFKLRLNGASGLNASGGTYIYAAFAENPFGGANVSPATAR